MFSGGSEGLASAEWRLCYRVGPLKMTSIPPASDDTKARKRPWYLVVALVLVSLTGVTAAADDCGMVGYYRGTLPLVDQPIGDGVTDEDRQMIQAAALQVEAAREQDRRILF